MRYIEHFNCQSENYLCYRPNYPDSLFDFLALRVRANGYVWDCGTGNGQAAQALSRRFQHVIATDVNFSPLRVGSKQDNIHYVCCCAEKSPLLTNSIDLITIAQALHWFNFDNFYAEVERVAKPHSTIAAWCYSLVTINERIDPIIDKLYRDILGDQYWPKERYYVDEHYQTIPFPFKKIQTTSFTIEKELEFSALIGYLETWSAVKEYQNQKQLNPITLVIKELQSAWGKPNQKYVMRWPIYLLVGQIEK